MSFSGLTTPPPTNAYREHSVYTANSRKQHVLVVARKNHPGQKERISQFQYTETTGKKTLKDLIFSHGFTVTLAMLSNCPEVLVSGPCYYKPSNSLWPKAIKLWPGYWLQALAWAHRLSLLLVIPQMQGSKKGSLGCRARNLSSPGLHSTTKMARCPSGGRQTKSRRSAHTNLLSNSCATGQWWTALGSSPGKSRFHYSGDPQYKLQHSRRDTSLTLLVLKSKHCAFIYKLIIKSDWYIHCLSESQVKNNRFKIDF